MLSMSVTNFICWVVFVIYLYDEFTLNFVGFLQICFGMQLRFNTLIVQNLQGMVREFFSTFNIN